MEVSARLLPHSPDHVKLVTGTVRGTDTEWTNDR